MNRPRAPYIALVVHKKVEKFPFPDTAQGDDYAVERHIYHAEVSETFRGKQEKKIQYEFLVERGEETYVDPEPTIIALCIGDGGYYWPGVGSSFPGDENVVAAVRNIRKKYPNNSSETYAACER